MDALFRGCCFCTFSSLLCGRRLGRQTHSGWIRRVLHRRACRWLCENLRDQERSRCLVNTYYALCQRKGPCRELHEQSDSSTLLLPSKDRKSSRTKEKRIT